LGKLNFHYVSFLSNFHPVRLAYQPQQVVLFSRNKPAISQQYFSLRKISTSHQPSAERTGCLFRGNNPNQTEINQAYTNRTTSLYLIGPSSGFTNLIFELVGVCRSRLVVQQQGDT
jgi:hypothetical protein